MLGYRPDASTHCRKIGSALFSLWEEVQKFASIKISLNWPRSPSISARAIGSIAWSRHQFTRSRCDLKDRDSQ